MKVFFKTVLFIIWIPAIVATMVGFGVLLLRAWELLFDVSYFLPVDQVCTRAVNNGSTCIFSDAYQFFLLHPWLSIFVMLFGALGFLYAKKDDMWFYFRRMTKHR